jgi:hypothetical protein
MPDQKLHLPTFNAISNGNVVAYALRPDQKEVPTNQQRAEDANFIEHQELPNFADGDEQSQFVAKMRSRKWFLI